MCARSDAKIRGTEVGLYMGYYGGWLDIGGKRYSQVKEETLSRCDMFDILNHYKKSDVINLMLDLVDNSDEG